MRVLVLGGDGMLGHKVVQVLSTRFETFATFRNPEGLWTRIPLYQDRSRTVSGVNAADFNSVVRAMAEVQPDAVINCIGVVKQLKAAHDPVISLSLNSLFPHQLAELCIAMGTRMFHVSTDCVFSGRKGHYTEEDVPDAEDLYGRSKLLGEVDRPGCLTLRTSIFGREFLKSSGLLEWFLSRRGGSVRGYRNTIYSGFPTQVLARILGDIIECHPDLSGLFQVASQPICKYDLLLQIRDVMRLNIDIEPYDDPPCDRSLDGSRFVKATGYAIPNWKEMLAEVAADSTPYDEWRVEYGVS